MKRKEILFKLSIALFCAVLGILIGGTTSYLLAVFVFEKDLNQALLTIAVIGLIGSQLGIFLGLRLGNKLYKKRVLGKV